jgi:integrase
MIDFADFIVKQPLAFPNRPGTHNRTAVSPSGPPARSKRAAPKKPLSNMAMTAVMRRMEKGEFTVHGFRSSFRDWCGDATNFPRDVAEMALAHKVGDEVEQAYRRGSALAKRKKLMDAWSAYVSTMKRGENVVPIRVRK